MRRQTTFKQSDIARAVKGVLAAGLKVGRVEIGTDGKISILADGIEPEEMTELDKWRVGQAIVGNVETGGGSQKSEGQAHAKPIAHAPEQEMRSPLEEDREAVPERSDEER